MMIPCNKIEIAGTYSYLNLYFMFQDVEIGIMFCFVFSRIVGWYWFFCKCWDIYFILYKICKTNVHKSAAYAAHKIILLYTIGYLFLNA